MSHEIRPVAWTVSPPGEPEYSEMTTHVRIVDEAGGEFVEVEQSGGEGIGKVLIDPTEWPSIKAAIEHAFTLCRTCAQMDAQRVQTHHGAISR
jgi:hypothetical protein